MISTLARVTVTVVKQLPVIRRLHGPHRWFGAVLHDANAGTPETQVHLYSDFQVLFAVIHLPGTQSTKPESSGEIAVNHVALVFHPRQRSSPTPFFDCRTTSHLGGPTAASHEHCPCRARK